MQRLVPRISDVDRPPEIVVSNVSPYHTIAAEDEYLRYHISHALK